MVPLKTVTTAGVTANSKANINRRVAPPPGDTMAAVIAMSSCRISVALFGAEKGLRVIG